MTVKTLIMDQGCAGLQQLVGTSITHVTGTLEVPRSHLNPQQPFFTLFFIVFLSLLNRQLDDSPDPSS
jgi:hypothetical protein